VAKNARLGEHLIAEGLLGEAQLQAALAEQVRSGGRLGEILLRMGFLAEAELVRALTRCFGLPGVDLSGKRVDAEVIDLLPAALAEKHHLLPLFRKRDARGEVLYVGTADPGNRAALHEASVASGRRVQPGVVGPRHPRDALVLYYRGEPTEESTAPEVDVPTDLHAPGDTAPLVAGDGEASQPAPPRPRDVPTRQILRALVKLLIDKGVLTRREMLEAVHALDPRGGRDGDDRG
jgi:hypothetical protein